MKTYHTCTNKDCANYDKRLTILDEELSELAEGEYEKQPVCPSCESPVKTLREGE